MTTTESKSLGEAKKENKEGEAVKKKEQQHPLSESQRSISFDSSHYTPPKKSPTAPTLHSHMHGHHSMSDDGDLQMVVANQSHSHSSVHDDGANVSIVKELEPKMVKNIGEIEEGSKKEGKLCFVVLLGLRIAAFLLCKIAFSVLASDNQKIFGRMPSPYWQGFYQEVLYELHWYYYWEFKYCLSVNVIAFVYSLLQICDLVKYLVTKRHTLDPKLRGYFNIAMDQAMAYLLISAASSAATRTHDWKNNTGIAYKFVTMANASIVFSFFAFVAFVSSSIVSGFILCRFN
ncbi:CASP-like protein N24 [Abrus precatorius]|uniref:CASP-like protein n=1 Tax=Abrus precatorius TaxID=3816 RepID=A0A8B8LQX9_ABRPR|nr:CASP-like protein N24 [Abrus precatorius]